MDDSFNLSRFVEAQAPIYERVLTELRCGRKTSHWMWFIFPQVQGLGHSEIARRYAISGLQEARAYLQHLTLGARLRKCTQLVVEIEGNSAAEIFGYPDDLKFRSSMTLFAHATEENDIFLAALRKYFGGEFDPQTLERISG